MMDFDPIILETLTREYAALPAPLKLVVGKTVGALASAAGTQVREQGWRKVFGDREERAVKRALTKAVASVVESWDPADAVKAVRILRRPPFRDEIILILRNPEEEINRPRLEEVFRKKKIDIAVAGTNSESLLLAVATRFLSVLRDEPDARTLYTVTRLDQIYNRQVEMGGDVREVRTILETLSTPDLPRANWLAPALESQFADARADLSEGRLEEAERGFRRLLDFIRMPATREAARASGEESTRRTYEQALLLSFGQLMVRRDDRTRAASFLEEARALQPLEEKNRLRAGWILVNLGRAAEAREILDPHDGTPEWRTVLGIALLADGAFEEFRRVFPRDADILDPVVLVALVRHHARHGALLEAEHITRRIISRGAEPNDVWRGITAATELLGHYADSLTPQQIDAARLIADLRRLQERAEELAPSFPVMQLRDVLRHRVWLHHVLLEAEPKERALRALLAIAPSDAISVGGWTHIPDAVAEDLSRAAREKADDPIEAALVEAGSLAARGASAEVAARLARVRSLAQGVALDRVVSFELEARARAGEDPASLHPRLDEISDPVGREIVRVVLAAAGGRRDEARDMAEEALTRYPDSLRLLRVVLARTRDAAAEHAQRGEDASDLRRRAVELADRLVCRLPCPEHRITRAKARALAGDVDLAYDEVREVVDSGYSTPVTAELLIDLARRKGRLREYAREAEDYYHRVDRSPQIGFTAADAMLLVGEQDRARGILQALTSHEDRRVAARAYHALAQLASVEAPEDPEAPVRAVRILMEGYERLDRPEELVAPLLRRGLGTRLASEVEQRLVRDFGSIAGVPGYRPLTEEQYLRMEWLQSMRVEVMEGMLRCGAATMEAYAARTGHEFAFEWFRRRVHRLPLLVFPPRFPHLTGEELLPDAPPPLLLDKTALLMLAETGQLDAVLSSSLRLLIARETFDWLFQESQRLRENADAALRVEAQELLAFFERHPSAAIVPEGDEAQTSELASALGRDHASDLAAAAQAGATWVVDDLDPEAVPPAYRDRLERSDALLTALVLAGKIGWPDAARAVERASRSFSGRSPARPADLGQPALLGYEVISGWRAAELLDTLADALPQLLVGSGTVESLRMAVADAQARDEAIRALEHLRTRVMEAVDGDRVSLVPPDIPSDVPGHPGGPAQQPLSRDPAIEITWAAERAYQLAYDAGALIWSDDAATHLYLDPGGPLLPEAPDLVHRKEALRHQYPSVTVLGTPAVLEWLVRNGVLTEEQHTATLTDLARHRRLIVADGTVLADAAKSHSAEDEQVRDAAQEVLAALGETTSAVPDRALVRLVPRVAAAVAAALDALWFEQEVEDADAREAAVSSLLDAVLPWISKSHTYGYFTASAVWSFLASRLIGRLDRDPGSLIQFVLNHASGRPDDFAFLLTTAGRMLDVALQSLEVLAEEARALAVHLYRALSRVIADFQAPHRPLVPLEALRLSARSLGLEPSFRMQADVEMEDGIVKVEYTTRELEQEAARYVEARIEHDAGGDGAPEPYLGVRVEFDARVVGQPAMAISVQADVNTVHVLSWLGPRARLSLLRSLQAFYERTGAMDLAEIVETHLPDVAAEEEETAEQGLQTLLHDLLYAPRTWLELDPLRFFALLRDAPYDHLRAMVGWPERWRGGECLLQRLQRLMVPGRPAEDVLQLVHSTWGPFAAAIRQLEEFAGVQARNGLPGDELQWMLEQARVSGDPYIQIFRIGLVLADLAHRPEMRGFRIAAEGGVTLEETVRQRLVEWIRAGLDGYDQAVRLHDLVTRLVFAAVFDPAHIDDAVTSHGEVADADPLGDLLFLGHLLVQGVFPYILSLAEDQGSGTVVANLEAVSSQYPLGMSGSPANEVLVPDLLGTTAYRADPYLTTLMAILETDTLARTEPGATVPGEDLRIYAGADWAALPVPFWWSAELEDELKRLAARERSPAARHLEELAEREETANRFGLLVMHSAETRARRLLERFGRGPSLPD
jgi:tetratricopeptide (TPR) repeat protein